MRAVFLYGGFPTHRVRSSEHVEELVLPSFPEIFDDEQAHPISDTCDWLNALYTVNAHHEPEARIGDTSVANLCIRGTAEGGITEIRRTIAPGQPHVYRMTRPVATVGNKNDAVLSILHRPQQSSQLTFQGKELFQGPPTDEWHAREHIQPVVRHILTDLGYGDPAEFARTAKPLPVYREEHGIRWPRPLNLQALSQAGASSIEPPLG